MNQNFTTSIFQRMRKGKENGCEEQNKSEMRDSENQKWERRERKSG
jgi:hypothetical protein